MTIRQFFRSLLFLGYQTVTRGKNKLPHGQYTSPQFFFFIDSEPPIKRLVGVPIISAPTSLTPPPPYRGAKLWFLGVITDWPFWPHKVKYCWGDLNLKYNFIPSTLKPLSPLDINRGALWGAGGPELWVNKHLWPLSVICFLKSLLLTKHKM